MGVRKLLVNIDELRELVGNWRDCEKPAQVEMDMALDRVKRIYEMLRFPEVADAVEECEAEVTIEPEPRVEEAKEPAAEPVAESVAEPVKEPVEEMKEETLIEVEEVVKEMKSERRRHILSLYEDEDGVVNQEPEDEPQIDSEPKVESVVENKVESEVVSIVSTIDTVSVTTSKIEIVPLAESRVVESVAPEVKVDSANSIFSSIGINDRFLLLEDLFEGDMSKLNEVLSALDAQPSFDDAMIYIAENCMWDGDSGGAQLLFSLLESRYLRK